MIWEINLHDGGQPFFPDGRVGRVMLNLLFTHYAIPMCSKLYQLCLKLCPKFAYYAQPMPIISGRNKLVCLNNYLTMYRKSKLKQHRLRLLIIAPLLRRLPAGHGTRYFWSSQSGTGTWSEDDTLPVYHRHMLKIYLLFPHNTQCFLVSIIPKIMPA